MVVTGDSIQVPIRQPFGVKELATQTPAANSICPFKNHGAVGGTSNCREGDLLPLSCNGPDMANHDVQLRETSMCWFDGVEMPLKDPAFFSSSTPAPQVSAEMPELIPEGNNEQAAGTMLPQRSQHGSENGSARPTHKADVNISKPAFAKGCPNLSYAAGQRMISFTAKEIEELAAPFEFTLIGKFSHGFPSMKTLKMKLSELNLKSDFLVSLLEYKHVLLRLSCEEDYTRIFSRQVLYMAGFPMRVFKWTTTFVPQEEAPFAPIWVKFPHLPVHLFDKRSLFTIASVIGKPLRIDAATTVLSRASTLRVCIEINLSENLLKEVEIVLDGKTILQEVEYENIPNFCDNCKHLGHVMSACLKLSKADIHHTGSVVSRPVQATFEETPAQQNTVHQLPVTEVHPTDKLVSPPKDRAVAVSAQERPSCQVSPPLLYDSVSNPGSIGSIVSSIKRVNAEKIKEDIFNSYELFENVSEPASVCISIENYRYMPSAYVEKKYFSDGDNNRYSAPIILPPKKRDLAKGKTVETKIEGANSKIVEEWFEANNRLPEPQKEESGSSKDGEGFIKVVLKKKKKKIKEKKNPT